MDTDIQYSTVTCMYVCMYVCIYKYYDFGTAIIMHVSMYTLFTCVHYVVYARTYFWGETYPACVIHFTYNVINFTKCMICTACMLITFTMCTYISNSHIKNSKLWETNI